MLLLPPQRTPPGESARVPAGRAHGARQRPATFTPQLETDTEAPSQHSLPGKAAFIPEYEHTMLPMGLDAHRELLGLPVVGEPKLTPREGLQRSNTHPYVHVRMMCAHG